MNKLILIITLLMPLLGRIPVLAQMEGLILDHADVFEVVTENGVTVTYVTGAVRFRSDSTMIECDSAIWRRGENVRLHGNVAIDDPQYQLRADSVFFDVNRNEALAQGSRVTLWSYSDSIYAVGKHAFYVRDDGYLFMRERPLLLLNYPDSASMMEVIADSIEYRADSKDALAMGNVLISSTDLSSKSGLATLDGQNNILSLSDKPSAKRGNSIIVGDSISITMADKVIDYIEVIGSANGEFNETVDSLAGWTDQSILRGERIDMQFEQGKLRRITCSGQAYSWYYPSSRGSFKREENAVSGDTVRLYMLEEDLKSVEVIGGAVGSYIYGEGSVDDSAHTVTADTIDYQASYLDYRIEDSLITLVNRAHVTSGTMSLDAHRITFDTERRTVEAFSAALEDSLKDSRYSFEAEIQPNEIPVLLKDVDQEILGDYLEYSMVTKKGRLIQSRSSFENGYYYGKKSFREQEDIFYVNDGRYTTCDAGEPHFHFYSKSMKLIENNKLIARPMVLYIERIPVFYLPFYVFPLKKGRHSGILPFTFGQFDQGDRWVRNIGYYWAISDYFDWQGALDYFEQRQTVTLKSRLGFSKRYVLNGYVSGNYTKETFFNSTQAVEGTRTRWVVAGNYNHTFDPSFRIAASGDFQSDETYFKDFSFNLDERLNRVIKSQASFTKKFGKAASLSGRFTHTVDLDNRSRSDLLPSLNISLPTIWPFGSGSKDENGKLRQNLLQKITFRYSPSLVNVSNRITIDSIFVDSTTSTSDTVSYRSRKEYTRISHNPAINLPTINIFKYLLFTPRFSYSETWFKVYETDQSRAAGIDAAKSYRTYSYSGGISMKTTLYGMLYPNLIGLTGLRHVVTPTIIYSYSPDIDRHPDVRSFAGGGAGSKKRSSLTATLSQVFQAKVFEGAMARTLDLASVTSAFSYNFEATNRPMSNVTTSFQSSAVPKISFRGSMSHSVYKPGTDDIDLLSPTLLNFNLDADVKLAGNRFLFDDQPGLTPVGGLPGGLKGSSQPPKPAYGGGGRGWTLVANYSFRESGQGTGYNKSSFLGLSLRFNLTPSTTINYSHRYDIDRDLTINNRVSIVKNIHCWTGSIHWVPTGSNQGFGFKLHVTALPELKIDSKHDSFLETLRR